MTCSLVLPRPLDVREAKSANDVYDMCGYYDSNRRYVHGDHIPRLMRHASNHWMMMHLMRNDDTGEMLLTSTTLPNTAHLQFVEVFVLVMTILSTYCEEISKQN